MNLSVSRYTDQNDSVTFHFPRLYFSVCLAQLVTDTRIHAMAHNRVLHISGFQQLSPKPLSLKASLSLRLVSAY